MLTGYGGSFVTLWSDTQWGMFPVFWAQKGSYLVKTISKVNPFSLFSPKIDVWDPKTRVFPGHGSLSYVTLVYGNPYITYHPHYGVGTLTLLPSRRGYRTKLGESTTHIMPPDVMYALFLNRLGRGATRPPLAERGSKLGSRTLGADHSGGHLFYPLWKPTWIMPTLHLTIENHGTHTKAIIFSAVGRCARACPPKGVGSSSMGSCPAGASQVRGCPGRVRGTCRGVRGQKFNVDHNGNCNQISPDNI